RDAAVVQGRHAVAIASGSLQPDCGPVDPRSDQMTRFPNRVKREDLPPEDLAAFDHVTERQSKLWGRVPDYWPNLSYCPPFADWWNDGGALFIAGNTGYTAPQREWVDMVVSQEIGCTIIYIGHMPDAIAVGVRPEAIKALRDGRDEDLEPDE